MDRLTITKAQLRKALEDWEVDHRAGRCRPRAATDELPLDQVVRESTDQLWARLSKDLPRFV